MFVILTKFDNFLLKLRFRMNLKCASQCVFLFLKLPTIGRLWNLYQLAASWVAGSRLVEQILKIIPASGSS